MNPERIFNIFLICNDGVITTIGFRIHDMDGTDEEKVNFLLSRVEPDSREMAFLPVSDSYKVKLANGDEVNGLTHERFNNLLHNGTESVLYEPIFQIFDAPEQPLTVSTMIVDGHIRITKQEKFETAPKTNPTFSITESVAENYLEKYNTKDGFDFASLIEDDFIEAIRLLFDKQKFVSATKLLMAAVDTFAFLEYGDTKDNFKNWLATFSDLGKVKVTIDELWEYRNSILHMTNAHSRKVIQNKVGRLAFYVSENEIDFLTLNGEAKYFNLFSLYRAIKIAIDNWIESYNEEPSKFQIFSRRYDLIMSDIRYNKIEK